MSFLIRFWGWITHWDPQLVWSRLGSSHLSRGDPLELRKCSVCVSLCHYRGSLGAHNRKKPPPDADPGTEKNTNVTCFVHVFALFFFLLLDCSDSWWNVMDVSIKTCCHCSGVFCVVMSVMIWLNFPTASLKDKHEKRGGIWMPV